MRILFILLLLFVSTQSAATSQFIHINGHKVAYQLKGTGSVTLMLEAGGSAGLEDWDTIYPALTKQYQVLRYSRIGNGQSEAIKKHYSAEMYAHEAKLLLAALKIRTPVVYIAHSYGAHVARVFAATYPESIAALMLIEPASEHDVTIMRKLDLALAERQIAQIKKDDMKNGMSNQYLDFWSKRPLPNYPEIPNIPVTVIASTKYYDNPSVLFFTNKARDMWGQLHRDWANAFPQGRSVLTTKSYHYPQNDEPERVINEIHALVQRIQKNT